MTRPAALPTNEKERLAVLKRLNILDTPAEAAFDDIVALASQICQTSISLVSLVDTNRQWFKARKGLEASETPRDIAFCAHAILDDEVMVVEDALADDRFAGNPLVTEFPKIRFYAGMPLTIEDNVNVGTLCVIDAQPKRLSGEQIQALKVLGAAVVAHLRLHRLEAAWPGIGRRQAVCAWCRDVRTDVDGVTVWRPLHEYISSIEDVSHGMCPSCSQRLKSEDLPAG